MTAIMGIINITPDSFYELSRVSSLENAIEKIATMEKQGAEYIDIGGESTRPGSTPVSEEEELKRILPVLEAIQGISTSKISIDTMKPKVAREAVRRGAMLINDIRGGVDPEMVKVAIEHDVEFCIMHMQKNPEVMQIAPLYTNVIEEVFSWLKQQAERLIQQGMKKERIIIDPGIGFGKTDAHNKALLQNIDFFCTLGYRVLVGISRKSFLQRMYKKQANDLLYETVGMNMFLAMKGVSLLRVHDVEEHVRVLSALRDIERYSFV